MKEHLRITSTAEDNVVQAYIDAAVSYLDGWSGLLGRALVQQVWAIRLPDFPLSRRVSLPFPDVSAVTLQYYSDDALTTVSASLYRLQQDGLGSWLELDENASWPTPDDRADAVQVTMTVAADALTLVRAAQAIKLLVAHWYRSREAVGDAGMTVPLAFDAIVAPMRRVSM
jgi:uncharacterized phiE125 gp8 family phage protein